MSLSRAFTTRRHANKKSLDISSPTPQRSLTTKRSFAAGAIQRNKISAPVELISTTNMLTYNAPDLYPSAPNSATTRSSVEDSDFRSRSRSSTPPTSPDTSSIGSSPSTPEPNHLSCYFSAEGLKRPTEAVPIPQVPQIPQRALSHTKKSSMSLSSKRSMTQLSSAKNSIHTTRSSVNLFSAAQIETGVKEEHPFGNELAQVSELAEEFGVQENMQVIDAEEQYLISRGLFKFRAEDYMSEIHGLFLSTFGEQKPAMQTMWI
ncbi:hypothetical protein BP5796_10658 [Coleophoma crateriformis]|uniref:Uncharacterized protein n=1 Tax=Coleophoma crateriformis TaxID=565419 RepID=A0A3D8QQR0_9HELO|nr:hypothetical protein BP5796_10658 [Coleophoma crateriformis]